MLQYKPKKTTNKKNDPKNMYFFMQEKKEVENEDDEQLNSDESGKLKKITRENNHIYFHAEINRGNIFDLIEHIRSCEIDNIIVAHKYCLHDPLPIYIHINSYGGCVFSALSAIDIIKSLQVPVHTIIEGATASAGTLISVVADKRYIRPSAHMLIHQLSSGAWGKMQELEDDFENNKCLMDKIIEIYREHATIPKTKLKEILQHDLWWNVDICLKYGLVDEIWEKA